MALKTKVKEYREKAGYKQSELAEMVGARRETIVHLENGKYNPSLKLAMDIAKVFQVTVEELFEFTEDQRKLVFCILSKKEIEKGKYILSFSKYALERYFAFLATAARSIN